jgi:hypothetical protein
VKLKVISKCVTKSDAKMFRNNFRDANSRARRRRRNFRAQLSGSLRPRWVSFELRFGSGATFHLWKVCVGRSFPARLTNPSFFQLLDPYSQHDCKTFYAISQFPRPSRDLHELFFFHHTFPWHHNFPFDTISNSEGSVAGVLRPPLSTPLSLCITLAQPHACPALSPHMLQRDKPHQQPQTQQQPSPTSTKKVTRTRCPESSRALTLYLSVYFTHLPSHMLPAPYTAFPLICCLPDIYIWGRPYIESR